MATEQLSEVLEREIPDTVSEIGEIKRLVQDKARYCDERSKRLIGPVQNNYFNISKKIMAFFLYRVHDDKV